MADPQIKALARRLANLERQRLLSKQPTLGHSTIDGGGAIQVTNEDDVLTMIVGKQFDDTTTASVVTGPTPPTPIVPFLTVTPGALRIYWDGTFASGAVAPMDFARVLAYAEPLSTYTGPEPLNQALIVGQFTSATGAELTASLDPGVEYVVYFVAWTQAGKYSAASGVATATPAGLADAAELAAKSTVYRQAAAPWPDGDTGHADDIGDLWFNTSLGPGKIFDVISRSITTNVATITVDEDHDMVVGSLVTISGVDPLFDGSFDVTAITSTTLSYALTGANLAETASVGFAQGANVEPLNRPFIWDGSTWVATQDSDASAAQTLEQQTAQQGQDIATLRITATDAYNTAVTADGRVVISDYEPGPEDVAGKVDGSLWITRTRDRLNLITNPSFEVDLTHWSGVGMTPARVADSPAGDGAWVAEITNSAIAETHRITWNPGSPYEPCSPGASIAASVYMKLMSGSGAGSYISIEFFDAALASLGEFPGATITATTTQYDRAYSIATAPDLSASFLVRVYNPNASAVYRIDAALAEVSGKLGRYFDGGSEGGSWIDTPDLSRSALDGGAIIRLFTLEDGGWSEKFWTADTISSVNVDVLRSGIGYVRPTSLAAGTIDGALVGDNSLAVDKLYVEDAPCSEAVAAGDIVNVWNNEGIHMVRLAKASAVGYEAHGFVLEAAAIGAQAKVYPFGYNPLLTDLAPGVAFLSTTAGKVSSTPPTDVGTIVQRVGHAIDSTTLNFAALTSIAIT